MLQKRYAEIKKQNLKIFHIYNEKNLKGFTTTENDMKRGNSRFPPSNFRFTGDDILPEQYNQDNTEAENLDYDQGKALRDKQYEATKDYQGNAEEDDPDEEEEVAKSIADLPSQVVFKKKNKEDASLEDFKLLRIVGKGTFGKVF